MSVPELLLVLVVVWTAAQVFGETAERIGQPAVLGELTAGVLLGVGALGWVDPDEEVVHLLAEIGVLILLFEIGLETSLEKLLRVGGAATAVAVTGVVLPLAAGYLAGIAIGAKPVLALFLGATFTATSVGVTARVLRDLGHLDTTEARVILGAAVIDDVLGLMLLTLVTGVVAGGALSFGVALRTLGVAVVFLAGAILLGRILAPWGARFLNRLRVQGALIAASMSLAFALALFAKLAGLATIIGAFAAGLILAETAERERIERQARPVAHLFVPIFFVVVGAQVDPRPFNPLVSANWPLIGEVLGLSALAIATKWAAGVAPFWLPARKAVIGVGMIPRGEVGLIFAQVGRTSGLLSDEQFSVVVLVVMVTTFVAPVLLRRMLPPREREAAAGRAEGVEELVGGIE